MNLLTQIDELDRAIENGSPAEELRDKLRALREKVVEEEARPIDEMIDIMPTPEPAVETFRVRIVEMERPPYQMALSDELIELLGTPDEI